MTVFDVYVNGCKLCRAGVGEDGVLDAIVSWAKLTGPAARSARRLKRPSEETRLHVGGLAKDTHRRWPGRDLKAGDRVTIAVVDSEAFDPPIREEPRDPKLVKRQEKRYYLHLKRKFEGPKAQHSSRRSQRMMKDDETTFLNVDLDIWSRSMLEPLVEAFGKKVCVLHVGKEGRRHGAHLELAASGDRHNCDQLIRRFVTLVKNLPRSRRMLWNRAQVRSFNVGIQAATKPHSYELRLQQKTLDAVASVNARVVITVYGAGLSSSTAKPPSQ